MFVGIFPEGGGGYFVLLGEGGNMPPPSSPPTGRGVVIYSPRGRSVIGAVVFLFVLFP